MSKHKTNFGFFDNPDQETPAFDPGLDVDCPACGRKLDLPVVTTSLLLIGDSRSYFYRMHKACDSALTAEERGVYDGVIIDAIIMTKNMN